LNVQDFILVGCILLRNVHDKNLSDIYMQSQLRVFVDVIISPCITTCSFIDVIISPCITTCFGPYGPYSGEYNISS
jgi:hypothetical protein